MNETTDSELLRAFVEHRSEAAFAELVRRHIDVVFSAARRMVCDAHLAEDVSQAVFLALAKSAGQLLDRPVLSGWLHRTAQNIAAQTVRTDVRRRSREQEASAMNELLATEPGAVWEHIAPHLDTALGELGDTDRDALMLRYFHHKSAQEMAQTLGVSAEAAQKRVNRAVEHLREFFARRGVKTGASGIIAGISANAVQAAPAGLALTISTAAAFAGTTVATTAASTATKAIAMTTLQKTMIGATLTVAVSTGIYEARQASDLRAQLAAVGQQQAPLAERVQQLQRERDDALKQLAVLPPGRSPRLPAPRLQAAGVSTAPDEMPSSDLIRRILNGENPPRLTAEQTEAFARENQRNAASLLAAFRTSRNPALLEEAMQRFPNDPQVAFEAVFKNGASPEQQRHWLEVFKQTAPENAMANYLSAANFFKAGQPDQAVQDLVAASAKTRFQDYTLDRFQADMEAYRSAGYPEAETSMAATWGLELPQLAPFKKLGQNMVDLAASYRQSGDVASAQTVLQMALNLGAHLEGANRTGGVPLITQLVGLAIQNMALSSLDPTAPYDAAGLTVRGRLDQIATQKTAIHDAVELMKPLQPRMTPQDWITYDNRSMMFGELNAIQWLFNKYGQQ